MGAAAGKITVNAIRKGLTSNVFATLSHSFLTLATPKVVFISIGQIAHMNITNTEEVLLSLIVYKANGIHARGETGFII